MYLQTVNGIRLDIECLFARDNKKSYRKFQFIQRVPANKKPLCIRNRSQFSYETIGYCSRTIGCTQKGGFLFTGTCCMHFNGEARKHGTQVDFNRVKPQ